MSDSVDEYTLEEAKDEISILRRVEEDVVTAIREAASEDVIEYALYPLKCSFSAH